MTTFTVSNTNNSGAGSFRNAIIGANESSGLNNIIFDIPGSEPQTIQLLSPLPDISDRIVIDGTTQSGYAGTPIIELNGEDAGLDTNGLTLTADASGSNIQGLAVYNFGGSGIVLDGSDSNQINGNYIGTDASGILDLGNQVNGISLENGASDNLIGGSSGTNLSYLTSSAVSLESEGNLILGNDGNGIALSGKGTKNNQIEGNYIGTDVSGKFDLGNNKGISISDKASRNLIDSNLISGNEDNGLEIIDRGTTRNRVNDNFIGTDVTGTQALGNGNEGIKIEDGASRNFIGTGRFNDRNLISGNIDDGVDIGGEGTNGNRVKGNYIGTDVTGSKALGNDDGVQIQEGSTENIRPLA